MRQLTGYNQALMAVFWGLAITHIVMGTFDPNQASILIFVTVIVAAIVFFLSIWMGTNYVNNFWLVHSTICNAALFFALHKLPWRETWPLLVMAVTSALLWLNMRPLYQATRWPASWGFP